MQVDEIYDTVIHEEIYKSESGVIKRKFYKRVIKSSPMKDVTKGQEFINPV